MSKSTELVVLDHSIPPGSSLAKKLAQLYEATQAWGESYFRMGIVLRSIYDDEDWRQANYTSFVEFMNDKQPMGVNARRGYQLMAASDRRKLLPDLGNNDAVEPGVPLWTEKSIRPLTHKDFDKADVRRLGKKIATLVKKGVKLTASLVQKLCDDDRGVEKKKTKKAAKKLKEASLEANLVTALEIVMGLQQGLGTYPMDDWEEVQDTKPHLITSVVTALDELASFLKE